MQREGVVPAAEAMVALALEGAAILDCPIYREEAVVVGSHRSPCFFDPCCLCGCFRYFDAHWMAVKARSLRRQMFLLPVATVRVGPQLFSPSSVTSQEASLLLRTLTADSAFVH